MVFQSTPARERATRDYRIVRSSWRGFNPRPLASGRRRTAPTGGGGSKFQSTPARERATGRRDGSPTRPARFNPRPLASGRRAAPACQPAGEEVSIHARSRAGDTPRNLQRRHRDSVSIHARSRAGDVELLGRSPSIAPFQSTPARERATADLHGGVPAV